MFDIKEVLSIYSERTIAYHPIYNRMTGGLATGVLLSQIIWHWTQNDYKEFSCSDRQLCRETAIHFYEFRRAKKELKKMGLIVAKPKTKKTITYYAVVPEILEKKLKECTMCKNHIRDCAENILDDDLTKSMCKNPNRECDKSPDIIDNIIEENAIKYNNINKSKSSPITSEDIAKKIKDEENIPYAFTRLSDDQQSAVQDIFIYWNSKSETGRWQSHTKLIPDMVKAIVENLNAYTIQDLKDAIDNYAIILQGQEYYWDYIWPLGRFFSVKHEKCRDGRKKWIQFLPENFVPDNYRNKAMTTEKAEIPIENVIDPDPELTSQLIKSFCNLINNANYTPSDKDIMKFRKAVEQMYLHLGSRELVKTGWIKLLLGCLERAYDGKTFIYPGSLCSEHTWSYLMPQYLKELGL